MGCINKNEIIQSEKSQPINNEESFKMKEENIIKNNSLKNSNNNKSNNRMYANSNNSGSNVTSNNKIYNNQLKDNTIGSLISNDYFNNNYVLLGEINNQPNIEEYKIQLKSNPNVFRCMRVLPKMFVKNQNNEDEDNSIFEEVNLLKTMTHKHICRLYECIATSSKYFLIMDYCREGNLENKLKWSIKYSENQIKYLAFQLFGAVKYLNKNNYMHTDIKPINILIDEITKNDSDEDLFNIKLLNFGSYGQSFENNNDNNNNINKLPYYIAPEIINNIYDVTSDVWSIGVIIYQMFYGEVPFGGENIYEVYDNIKRGKIIQSMSASTNLRNLLDLIFVKDYKKRINVNKCLEHQWFYVANKTQRNTDVYKNCIIEEINTDINVNKIDEKNSQNTYTSKSDKVSEKSNKNNSKRKSIKLISFKNVETFQNNTKPIKLKNNKNGKTCATGTEKNGKIYPLIKYCILFIKYYIRINFQKDKEINKLNKIYIKYKNEKNLYLFIKYINNTKKISFDSFNNDKNNKNVINKLKEQINDKEQLFKILIENKKKYIEINLKKAFDKLRKTTVEEIKKIFKESNNINLYEIQKYKLYFNEIEFEMDKNKYKEIYLFIDFYKLLINSINKLYVQFISNNISSTNVDSNYTTTTLYGINNKSKESIKNENSKDNIDKSDKSNIYHQKSKNQYDKEKLIPFDINKSNDKNKDQDNKSNNNFNSISINNSNNAIMSNSNNNENIDDNFLKGSNKKNNINIEKINISKKNEHNHIIMKRRTLVLNKTNILKNDKNFQDLIINKLKRKSYKNSINFFENFQKKNIVKNNEVNNNNIDFKDDEEDEYETEERKNDKNRFDPEKFLAIIGFS